MCIGLQQNDRSLLKIKAFYLRLSVSDALKPLPDSLTLHFLPRINGSPLDINDSRIRPDSPAFVTLHRVLSGERAAAGAAIFWSRERVMASEGVRFDVYLGYDKVLKGIFRRDESTGEWRIECKCALEKEMVGVEVTQAEVCVAVEGRVDAMSEKVEVAVRRRRGKYCFQRLEEIPEQREVDNESDGCCGCCSKVGSNGADFNEEDVEVDADAYADADLDMDGLGWAVDVGIWVMCLGVGYLVSKASSRSLRGKRLL